MLNTYPLNIVRDDEERWRWEWSYEVQWGRKSGADEVDVEIGS
jgi:hypothetical protein